MSTFEIFNRLTKKLHGWGKYHYSLVCVFTGLIRLHGDDSLTGTIHIESKYFLLIIFLAKKKNLAHECFNLNRLKHNDTEFMFNYPHPFFELVKAANQNCFDVNSNQTSEKTKTTFSVMVIRLTCIDLH